MNNTENINVNRRNFLRYTSLTGAALILGISKSNASGAAVISNLSNAEEGYNLSPFIIIEKSGKITIFNTKPEMGQGTFQSIPALIAEELELAPGQFTVVQTGGEKKFGDGQAAGGSYSVRSSYEMMRKVGASAREMLISAASRQWNVPVSECYAEFARVFHKPSGRSLGYGELVETASALEAPENPQLKDPKTFRMLGKSSRRPDVPLKVSGQAVFGIDVEVPGMVYASVERCPVFGAALTDFEASHALKVTGVEQVVPVERVFGNYKTTGVAVVASSYWAALKGRKELKVKWDYRGNDQFNSADYSQYLRDLAQQEGITDVSTGDFDTAFASGQNKVEAFYETPFVAHATMEPMNCTAHWKEGNKLEIWASTQVPSDIINEIPAMFGLSADDVTLHTCFNGGGFGRRLALDFVIEAVNLSKTIKKPVKLIWTREDDMQMGPYRPPTFSALKGALSPDGRLTAFQHKVIAPTILSFLMPQQDKTKVDETMVEGISRQSYEIPNMKNSFVYADCPAPLLWLSNWDAPLPEGKGRGIAQWDFFAGLAGEVVEVTRLSDNSVKIDKVYVVIDLGTVVNPDNVKAQMESSVVMGITAAVKKGITFANGRTEQSNYHDSPVLRITESPEVVVHILAEGGSTIKGVGEPGLPPVAPALANAIFDATGIRLRKMPFDLDDLKG
ncbi:MAG: molybdopterin-dependent oxidoreductase [Saprospiraceae bacterium]|nr:molybdopterin-dependent oxidoreductase [Saprospiraceae bacterium]